MTEPAWNPRYVCYALEVHGAPPAAALNLDRALWPGGCMAGFIIWIQTRCGEFDSGRAKALTEEDHAAFDAWLKARVGL